MIMKRDGFKEKIESKQAKVAVIGLGYVGLPLAVAIAQAGFKVFGIDPDDTKRKFLNDGKSYIPDVDKKILRRLAKAELLKASKNFKIIKDCEIVIICVPTPLTAMHEPDLSYIREASLAISENLKKQHLVILESTTYPGTTEEVVLPILEESGLKVGRDFYLVFSPERIDPGNKKYTIKNTPKVIGGITSQCTRRAALFYSKFVEKVVPVSSTKVAEMTKLLENIFRCVNIALVNELMLLCDRMGLSIWEVVEAASTKPFGFMKFTPGPGLGGHCIPIDPFYLSWKARQYDFHTEFIELAGKINEYIPYYVVAKVADALNTHKKSINGSKILIIGVAYKKDIGDTRESPALKVIELLLDRKARISYVDPYVEQIRVGQENFSSQTLNEEILKASDCVVIITDHTTVDYPLIVEQASLIVDTRNVLKKFRHAKIFHI
jgi:UDP-N-acetyl-D-glucosamine dehydrogenase